MESRAAGRFSPRQTKGFRMALAQPTARTLLVVEDNAITREGLAVVLRREGYAVVTAANGREALDCLRAGSAPALILLDMMMPAHDGWWFLEKRRRDPWLASAPVIITTGVGV